MSINVNDKNLGHATAYAYYKAGGGTMTEAEFTEFMADFGTASQTAVEAAQAALASETAAQTAATTATNKASEATTAATTATNKAAEAQADADAAALDASQALSAASTATTKASEATTAAATAVSAKDDAVSANTAAQSAKTAAQTAQTGAETAAASVSASVEQIATNASDISQLKSEFTALESDGAVPTAEQILSDKGVTDSVPYHYRKTGGDGADRLYDQIVGGTVCFNQFVPYYTFADRTTYGITFSRTGYKFSFSGTGANTGGYVDLNSFINILDEFVIGHKYLLDTSHSKIYVVVNNPYTDSRNTKIFSPTSKPTYFFARLEVADGESVSGNGYVNVYDLTAMFGSTIADYIYQLEQTTAGAGVAFFKSLFPNDYYPYNAGELVSVSGLSEHKTVGKNLLAKPFVHYESVNVSLDECFFIKSGTYMFHFDSTNATSWRFLVRVMDGDGNLLTDSAYNPSSGLAYYSSVNGWLNQANITVKYIPITIAKDCYIRIMTASGDTSANTTVTGAQLEFGSTATTYKPYEAHSYPLDSTLTLRGVPKLDSNNKLYFDGDTYDADGTVTRRYGVVDLGMLDWKASSTANCFYATAPLYKMVNNMNYICERYKADGFGNGSRGYYGEDGTIRYNYESIQTACEFYVHDSSYTDATAFNSAMSGVMLVYELATPTTEEADPYQHLQQCDPNGTEEYVSTGIVPIGHNSFYPENLRAKVEQLPWNFANLIAPTESTFTATRNYTTGALFIVSNVLYKATSNIANGGTITPNTNCTATTLAEIISALT